MSYVVLCVHILLGVISSLKIFENDYSNEYRLLYHRTAHFGPSEGEYNISAPLMLMKPLTGCTTSPSLNNSSVKGKVLLIIRGNCTFADKVIRAQNLGAVGVIVGNNPGSDDDLVSMASDSSENPDVDSITIPSVFTYWNDFAWITNLTRDSTYESIDNSEVTTGKLPGRRRSMLSDADSENSNQGYILVILDSDGEDDKTTNYFENVILLGYLLLIVPSVWCLITTFIIARRLIKGCYGKYRRTRQLRSIPLIEYIKCEASNANNNNNSTQSQSNDILIDSKGDTTLLTNEAGDVNSKHRPHSHSNSDSNSTLTALLTQPLRGIFGKRENAPQPHNDSCAICLDDFENGTIIKLLPCQHGFHSNCIDPWLRTSSELCPMCKRSIFDLSKSALNKDGSSSNSNNSLFRCCRRATIPPPISVVPPTNTIIPPSMDATEQQSQPQSQASAHHEPQTLEIGNIAPTVPLSSTTDDDADENDSGHNSNDGSGADNDTAAAAIHTTNHQNNSYIFIGGNSL